VGTVLDLTLDFGTTLGWRRDDASLVIVDVTPGEATVVVVVVVMVVVGFARCDAM